MCKLYKFLDDPSYTVRIAVVNLLFQLANYSKDDIMRHLKKRLKSEDVRSVKIAIKEAISDINKDNLWVH